MSVLYRKYRPQTFAEVVGQNHIKTTLEGEIAGQQLAHAYLFVGPRGTGKTTMARLFARTVNCLNRKPDEYEPCNQCQSCEQIKANRSMDIIEMDAATHTQVDNVRENIIANAQVPPYNSKGYKVFIIDEVHMLSKASFNALLKIIEEPPAHIIFILATTEVRKVPETIISRCQRFDFKKISSAVIVDRLAGIMTKEKIDVPKEVLLNVARRSEGCLRDAESLLGQIIGLSDGKKVSVETASMVLPQSNWSSIELLVENMLLRNAGAALKHLHHLIQEGADLDDLASDLVEYLRQIVLSQALGVSYAPDFEESTVAKIKEFAEKFSTAELLRLLEIFMTKAAETRSAMIPQLPLELGIVEFIETSQGFASIDDAKSTDNVSLENQATVADSNRGGLTIDGQSEILRDKWLQILNQIKDYNYSLAAFLKVGHPLKITDNLITIGFQYDFHAERVRESKNKMAAEDAIANILGRKIRLESVVDKNYLENHQKFHGAKEKEVEELLDIIGGGQVV